MRIFTALMVALAVLATAVVSVRLHLHVAKMRYRVSGLEEQRVRAEREMRLSQAELDAAKAPRKLMERWAELHGSTYGSTAARAAAKAPAVEARPRPIDSASDESADVSTDVPADAVPVADPGADVAEPVR